MRVLPLCALLPGCTDVGTPDGGLGKGDGGLQSDGGGCPGPGQWTAIRPPAAGEQNLFSLWGEAPDHLYAVGSGGTILRAVPSVPAALSADCRPQLDFSKMDSGTGKDLFSVHGTAPDNLFAVGLSGTIVHFDGTRWVPEVPKKAMAADPPFTMDLQSVFAYKDGAVAVGQNGTWVRRDKNGWGVPHNLAVESLAKVWGTPTKPDNSAYDIFAVGSTGFIFRFDGYNDGSWRAAGLDFTFTDKLGGVFGSGDENVFAVGVGGAILRRTQDNFSDYGAALRKACATNLVPQTFLRNGLVTSAGQVVIIGWDGVILRLSSGGCGDGGMGPSVHNESGVTDHRLEGIFSSGSPGASIYITGVEGVVLRGQ